MFSLYLSVKVSDQDDLSGRTRGPLFLNIQFFFFYMTNPDKFGTTWKALLFQHSLIKNASSKETKHHFLL